MPLSTFSMEAAWVEWSMGNRHLQPTYFASGIVGFVSLAVVVVGFLLAG